MGAAVRPLPLLDPKKIARVKNLEIVAKGVVEGIMAGLHRSPFHGASVEFAEHRGYVPGDDLRRLDWKMLAKSDRAYIKKYEEETDLRCLLAVDASGSMDYGEGDQNKLRYAKVLAAAFSYLLLMQRDAVGLAVFDDKLRRVFPPRGGARTFRAVTSVLGETNPGADTGIAGSLHLLSERFKRRGLLVLISDLFDEPKELLSGLAHFRFRHHDVLVLHVVHPDEEDLPFNGWTRFEGLEPADAEVFTEPQRVRKEYRERYESFVREIQSGCRFRSIDYARVPTSEPWDRALARILGRRAAR